MSGGTGNDESFFVKADNSNGGIGSGQSENPGAIKTNAADAQIDGGPSKTFEETPEAPKKRGPGRPAGSKNRSKENSDGTGLGLGGDELKDKLADKAAKEIYTTIKNRHLMLAMLLGLPQLTMIEDEKLMAQSVAYARFQQEFPRTKISRKMSVCIDLAATSTASYFPVFIGMFMKMKQAADAKKNPRGFQINPNNPQGDGSAPPRQQGAANGHGGEFVITNGVTDKPLEFG